MNIPFVDLKAQYLAHQPAIDRAMAEVIAETGFIGGAKVSSFERDFAAACGVRYCVSVANGTDAIYIALRMLGIGPGDEVITVANSWISTSEAVTQTGARPVFVDIDEYFHIDAARIEEKITSRTKAILPVHLYGQPADMAAISQICAAHDLKLVEDCAQAHFAEFQGQKVGTFGAAGTFSFYPGKNLGAYGDAGGIVTGDEELAARMRMYANHGALVKHRHLMEGINSRLDALQAAVLSAKLPHVTSWNERRFDWAQLYSSLLADLAEVQTPRLRPGTSHVFHLYVVRVPRRDALQQHLSDCGIQTAIHYPTPLPLLPAYAYMEHSPADFPAAVQVQREILSLPLYPEITEDMVSYVVQCIRTFYRG